MFNMSSSFTYRVRKSKILIGLFQSSTRVLLWCSSPWYEPEPLWCLLKTAYLSWSSTCMIGMTSKYWTFCLPVELTVTWYVGGPTGLEWTITNRSWDLCPHGRWHICGRGNRLQTIIGIQNPHGWLLLFGLLHVTWFECNMLMSSAGIVGEHGKSPLWWLSYAPVLISLSVFLQFPYSPRGHHGMLLYDVGVLDSELLR